MDGVLRSPNSRVRKVETFRFGQTRGVRSRLKQAIDWLHPKKDSGSVREPQPECLLVSYFLATRGYRCDNKRQPPLRETFVG